MTEKPSPSDFYADALSQAERLRLPQAHMVEGLDEEIALLRVRLFTAVQKRPEELELLLRGVNALVRLAAMRYRLSDKPAEQLSQSIAGVLEGIGGALYQEHVHDG